MAKGVEHKSSISRTLHVFSSKLISLGNNQNCTSHILNKFNTEKSIIIMRDHPLEKSEKEMDGYLELSLGGINTTRSLNSFDGFLLLLSLFFGLLFLQKLQSCSFLPLPLLFLKLLSRSSQFKIHLSLCVLCSC